jgi:energy-coupling factor transporter transmembrane protein EcfT
MLHEGFLGSGRGPLTRVDPAVRLLFGAGMLAACVAAPGGSVAGSALVTAAALGTGAATGLPGRRAARILGLGLLFYVPFLLVLMLPALLGGRAGAGGMASAATTMGAITLKGLASLLVTLSVASTLRPDQLHEALSRLPLPAGVRLLLIQIGHQTGLLFEETLRLRQVLAVRGAGSGLASSLRLVGGLPAVWLARVAHRADRVAAAMELRGYASQPMPSVTAPARWHGAEWAAMGAAACALAAAALLHAPL